MAISYYCDDFLRLKVHGSNNHVNLRICFTKYLYFVHWVTREKQLDYIASKKESVSLRPPLPVM